MVYYFKFLSSITIYSWNFLEQGQENQEELALNNCEHVEHMEQGYNVSCSCKIIFQQIRNVLDTTKKNINCQPYSCHHGSQTKKIEYKFQINYVFYCICI